MRHGLQWGSRCPALQPASAGEQVALSCGILSAPLEARKRGRLLPSPEPTAASSLAMAA